MAEEPLKHDVSDLGKLTDSAAERDIEIITAEIIQLKRETGNGILKIGQRLIEAKEKLPHGEWLPWLEERVEFTDRTARNFMRLAREWTDRKTLSDLGAAKALSLLALPSEEREAFMFEVHVVNGEEKTVIDMTSRELEKAIRERDEARKLAAAAQAEAQSAEESRVKMENDMKILRQLHEAAQAAEAQAREAMAMTQAELKAIQERPVEVAVETVVDQEAIDKARAEAIAEMQSKVNDAENARQTAEQGRKTAEAMLNKAKADAAKMQQSAGSIAEMQRRAEKAEAELKRVQRQLEEAGKEETELRIASDGDLSSFNLLFNQIQALLKELHSLMKKVQGRDEIAGEKLKKALLALVDVARGYVE